MVHRRAATRRLRLPSALAAALLLGLGACGCGLPDSDRSTPEGTHYELVRVRAAGDSQAFWDLLHPDIQSLVTRWHSAEKDTVFAIRNIYPDGHRKAALEALDGGVRGDLTSPRALFEYLMEPGGGASLGTMATLGARASAVARDGERATVSTWAGDKVFLRKGPDDLWFASLSPTEEARLVEVVGVAESNRERSERAKEIFRGELPGGAQ